MTNPADFMLISFFLLAFGMASTIKYIGNKSLPKSKNARNFLLVLAVLIVILGLINFIATIFVTSLLYCIHGPIMMLLNKTEEN